MKLCQKCSDEIGELVAFKSSDELWDKLMIPNVQVPDSECEFYLHKRIREVAQLLDKKTYRGWTPYEIGKTPYVLFIRSEDFEEAIGRLAGNYDRRESEK